MATTEQRLAALEAALISPRAAVPPMTIGELVNVPVPGANIAAQWAQDVSSRVVQRFPTTAALKAWAAPTGAHAVALDTGVEWRRYAAGWSQVTPWQSAIGGGSASAAGFTTLATIAVPADPGPRIITASCFLRVNKFTPGLPISVTLEVDSVIQARHDIEKLGVDLSGFGGMIPSYVAMTINNIVANTSGSTVVMKFGAQEAPAGNWSVPTNSYFNRLDVLVTPRGY